MDPRGLIQIKWMDGWIAALLYSKSNSSVALVLLVVVVMLLGLHGNNSRAYCCTSNYSAVIVDRTLL